MTYGTRTYRCPINDEGDAVPRDEATWELITINEVLGPDGTESLLDEYTVPLIPRHDPDPAQALADAGDEAYHERKDAGLL